MKTLLTPLLAATLALAAAPLFAQTQAPGAQPPAGEQRARPTPEQRQKMHEAVRAAREACKDSPDRRACMTEKVCAQASDPARCQARAKERYAHMAQRMDERQAAHEACTGKRGDELMKCLGEHRKKK